MNAIIKEKMQAVQDLIKVLIERQEFNPITESERDILKKALLFEKESYLEEEYKKEVARACKILGWHYE